MEEFTLCAYSPRVVDTLAWRSRPWTVFVSLFLINEEGGEAVTKVMETEPLPRLEHNAGSDRGGTKMVGCKNAGRPRLAPLQLG
jgi:hypothetical protein